MDMIRITKLLLLISRIFLCQEIEGANFDFDYTSGIIVEENKEYSPIFYESFVPMLFEYSLPDFSSSALELTTYRSVNGYSGLCDKSEFDYKCPPWFYMDDLLKDQFSPNLTWWLSGNAHPFSFRDDKKFCNNIDGHFLTSTLAAKVQFDSYVEKLRMCSLGQMVNKTAFISYTRTRQDYYDTMSRNIGEAYWFLPSKIDAVVALNMQQAIYSMFLLDQYMESKKWKEAFSTCKSGKIPSTIVSNEELINQLKTLRIKLQKKQYNLSIPITDINSYLHQPLADADCVITKDSLLVVRILIPVVSNSSSYQLLQLKTIPFAKVDTEELCFVPGLNGNAFILENFNKVIKQTQCKERELCQVDSSERPFIENPCVSNLASYSSSFDPFSHDHNMCPLKCYKYLLHGSIIFQRISPDTVVIASAMISNCFLQCPGKPDLILSTKEMGALRVTVPCHCAIVYNMKEQFRSESLCRSETVIKHIVPYGWQINEDENNNITLSTKPITTTTESILGISPTTIAPITTTITEKYPDDNDTVPNSKQPSYADKSASEVLFSIIFLLLVVISVALLGFGYKLYKLEKNLKRKRSVGSEDTACILNGEFYQAPPL